MTFDWVRFLEGNRIDFVTRGPNIARGNVGVRCPWCGDADQSHHLGISLSGRGWGCWRSASHRGKSPARLIQALLGCSFDQARRIAGEGARPSLGDPVSFADRIRSMVAPPQESQEVPARLSFPPEIRSLSTGSMSRLFRNYLIADRGYTKDQAHDVSRLYHLRYATRGPFRYRLVFPVYSKRLVNWTGRTIDPNVELRYRTLSANPDTAAKSDLPVAPKSIDRTLWNYRELSKDRGLVLVVCEGPFDAMRVDYFGRDHGIRATCVFTKDISQAQIDLLDGITHLYQRRVLLLDPDAKMDSLRILSKVQHLGFRRGSIPTGLKDPALMSERQVVGLFSG